MSETFDAIIAGGGLSGLITASRLAALRPEGRYLVLEKESRLGGRLRATDPEEDLYGYGLNALSERLYDVWHRILRSDSEGPDLAKFLDRRQATFGVLSGQRISETTISSWFTPQGAKILGGPTAAKGWGEVEEICRQGALSAQADDESDEDPEELAADRDTGSSRGRGADNRNAEKKSHTIGHYWKSTRKVPAAVVLEHFANALGIPDVWNATPRALSERSAYHSSRLFTGSFEDAFQALLNCSWFQNSVKVVTKSRITHASYEGCAWKVIAQGAEYQGEFLIVAQPPWQALTWLPKPHWPAHILQVANKTKPVSVVVLTEKILDPNLPIPDVTVVPSEHVQAIRNSSDEICFQATIDYELSLQAPAVVKAVKALKRARRKLLQLYPGVVGENGHIALQPIAWAQSPAFGDKRWIERLQKKSSVSKSLAFVGDAYGDSYDGDTNMLTSLRHLEEAMKLL